MPLVIVKLMWVIGRFALDVATVGGLLDYGGCRRSRDVDQ